MPDQVLQLLDTRFGRSQPTSVNRVAESAPAPEKVARRLMSIDLPGAPPVEVSRSAAWRVELVRRLLSNAGPDHNRQRQIELGPEPDAARLHDQRAIGLRYAQVGDTVRGRLAPRR